jgi:glycosyltransferase involved in cell wall biosynthesis
MNDEGRLPELENGERYFAAGMIDKATEVFEKVLEEHPDHVEALNNLGVIVFYGGDIEKAERYFRRALEIDENHKDSIVNLSSCCEARGEFRRAIELYWRLVCRGECDDAIVQGVANSLVRLNEPRKAQAVLDLIGRVRSREERLCILRDIIDEILHIREGEEIRSAKVLNIGFVSIWFERGQAYVSKMIRDVVATKHETFVFARTGAVYGQPKLEAAGFWSVPNLTTYGEYGISSEVLTTWIRTNQLTAVVFNEEYDWNLVLAAKAAGAKVLTYLDYYKEDWKPFMRFYDGVLCSTQRTYNLVRGHCSAYYVGWAVDTELFRPSGDWEKKATFFHNAGWLGINYRKMTPAVILAFDAVSKCLPDITLFIHAQTELERLPPGVVRIVRENPRITYHVETLPAPGLYHKGRILVFPSKLEGLGLPLFEGMSCGLGVIATDAPPMNEFVREGYNGMLIRVAQRLRRQDNIAFPEAIIDVNHLALLMHTLALDVDLTRKIAIQARRYIEEEVNMKKFGDRVCSVIEGVCAERIATCRYAAP